MKSWPGESPGAPLGDHASASRPKFNSGKLALLLPLVHALALCLVAEAFNQKSATLLWHWCVSSPHLLALNVLVYLSITWLFILLTNRIAVGCVLSSLVLLLPVISSFKMAFLLVPLLPTDIKLVTQMTYLMSKYGSILVYIPVLLGAMALLMAAGYVAHRMVKMRFALPVRAMGMVASLGILSAACYQAPRDGGDPVEQLISTSSSDLVETFHKQGFAVAFGSLTEQAMIIDPAYTRKAVNRVVAELRPEEITSEPEVKPDIIAILSEAMWDPTQLPGVQFSQDPLPNLRRLQKEGVGLQFLSPTFGGGTANIEFELLTGFTTGLMPEGSYPFVEPVMYSPQPSIARFLGSMGYRTIGIHNYTRAFWKRTRVYPNLGFQEFQSAEDFSDPKYSGEYIADAALGERMMDQLARSKGPTFMFGITMQNHGSYSPNRYDHADVRVESSTLSERELGNLQSYTQGIYETDQMLGKLTEFLKQRKRPAIVIYFGDHLPAIGTNFELQSQTGFVQGDSTAPDRLKLHATPALIWANYPVNLCFDEKVISAGLIWPELLQAIGMDHAFYTRFLDRVRKELPGISRNVYVDAAGIPMLHPPLSAYPILQEYWLLQHDVLDGKRYSFTSLFPRTAAAIAAGHGVPAQTP